MLIDRFYPDDYVESVFAIDYERLYAMGFRGLVFDIDNTLVPHGADSTAEVDELFQHIHAVGLKTLLLSNNSEARVLRFKANIDSLYIYDAHKPDPASFAKAVEMLGLRQSEVLVVGDQVFIDILGANSCGLASILVKYIGYYRKEKKGIRRNVEKIILRCYRHSRKHNQRKLNIEKL